MNNKTAILIGGVIPESMFQEIMDMGSDVDYAANKFQLSFIDGLSKSYEKVIVISAPLISSFPKANTICFRKKRIRYLPNVDIIITGYVNLPIIKMASKCARIFGCLSLVEKEADLLIYSPHSPFLVASYPYLRRLTNNSLIIPDLPEFMASKTSKLYLLAKKIDHAIIDFCLKRINSYILFSSLMSEKVKINGKPCMVMEGIYKNEELENDAHINTGEKIILYTGRADERYGIRLLLDAFAEITDPDFRLYIRGDGSVIEEVNRRSVKDKRIKHIGKLSSKDLKRLQQQASVLFNPVSSKEEFTKYFFPSKTMEYLASGTPTVMSRLKCMPKEYESYVFYYDEDTPKAIKDKIIEVCSLSDEQRKEYGIKARQFILKEKNADIQAARVKAFMESL